MAILVYTHQDNTKIETELLNFRNTSMGGFGGVIIAGTQIECKLVCNRYIHTNFRSHSKLPARNCGRKLAYFQAFFSPACTYSYSYGRTPADLSVK